MGHLLEREKRMQRYAGVYYVWVWRYVSYSLLVLPFFSPCSVDEMADFCVADREEICTPLLRSADGADHSSSQAADGPTDHDLDADGGAHLLIAPGSHTLAERYLASSSFGFPLSFLFVFVRG
jgi:hypothetical protein